MGTKAPRVEATVIEASEFGEEPRRGPTATKGCKAARRVGFGRSRPNALRTALFQVRNGLVEPNLGAVTELIGPFQPFQRNLPPLNRRFRAVSGASEDLVAADSSPADASLAFDLNPLEGSPPIGARERPSHFKDTARPFNISDAK